MTPHERRVPHVIDGSRRKRIAAGSGTTVEQVNQLIEAPQADGEDDEDDGIGQDARSCPGWRRERLPSPGRQAPAERDSQVEQQAEEEESEEVTGWQ